MCGIAVAINWDGAEAVVQRLVGGILHRGDITDPIVSPRSDMAMCTRRLRIVDADHGEQPQVSFDGALLVAFNGEIYNHVELRRELCALGVTFDTESDTEVLANALRVWGAGALQRLVGMYAFVAIELATGEFLAARDPFGVKPLYLIQSGEGFVFCSEIRPLLASVDRGDVLLLPPGHLLMRKVFAPFKSALAPPPTALVQGRTEQLDRILARAVEIRIPPELPFATMFSGGIDSTLIAHYARRWRPEAPGYFLGGPGAPDYAYAARYADQTGYDLRLVPIPDAGEIMSSFIDDIVMTAESFEPEVIRNSLCTYVLARRIHQDGFRVALCGEGADELFAGYVPLEVAFAEGDEIGRPLREQCLGGMHRSNLQRVDRCSMRFQVETREPFLDPSVVNYAMTLAAPALVHEIDGAPRGKAPLRALYDLYPDTLPAMIRDRQKAAFNVGAGLDASQTDSPWRRAADQLISDKDFAVGKREFEAYDLRTKEELLYMERLAENMDISRVPHLKGRSRLVMPGLRAGNERLAEFIV